jgi:hypothetical protein
MNFLCTRTTVYGEKPCDQATPIEVYRIDRRTVDDPMKIRYIGADWYKHGKNHRVENGWICRDVGPTKEWAVNIDNLDELAAFTVKHGGSVVIASENTVPPMMSVEIYDGYRE